MGRTVALTHRIIAIGARDGKKINRIHVVLKKSDCTPVDITPGRNGLIVVERTDTKGELHRLLTSPVERVEMRNNDRMIITTQNTIYTLKKVEMSERKVFDAPDYWKFWG